MKICLDHLRLLRLIEIQPMFLKNLHIKIVLFYLLQWVVLGMNRYYHSLVVFYVLIIF